MNSADTQKFVELVSVCLSKAGIMPANKSISRVTDHKKQQAETDRYWRSLSIGERFSAVWDVSEAAYAFAAAFNGNLTNDAHRSERLLTRLQQSRS